MTDQELQSPERYTSRAAFYGIWLKSQGYAPDEALQLVAERYPALRDKLAAIAQNRNRKTDAAARQGELREEDTGTK